MQGDGLQVGTLVVVGDPLLDLPGMAGLTRADELGIARAGRAT